MNIFNTISDYQTWRSNLSQNFKIGFVPTMGALHKGHLALVERALKENDIAVVSIFVNPTQFDNLEDLKNYPSTLENDFALLKKMQCNAVFCPNANEIYSGNVEAETFDFSPFDNSMEGAHRKGHFDGVGTIVKLLFEVIKPHKAYFGEKDFQQLKVIESLVKQKDIPVEIIPCEIVRETSGLAMSSRNLRLNLEDRKSAVFIFEMLQKVKNWSSSSSVDEIKIAVNQAFNNHPKFSLEYFEIASEHDLQATQNLFKHNLPRAFIAANIAGIRLIDNMPLNR